MPAVDVDLVVEVGATFHHDFEARTEDPVDLLAEGWTARMDVRRRVGSPSVLLTLTSDSDPPGITLGDDGAVAIDMSATQTKDLTFRTARYDLELYGTGDNAGIVVRHAQGAVTTSPNVTRSEDD